MLPAVTKQKPLKILACPRHNLPHDAAQPDQVAHGFMIGVRHPDGRQLAGAMKPREHGGIAAICLHPIARLRRNQRRRHHVAPVAEIGQLAINAIPARPRLITKRQRLASKLKALAQFANRDSIVGYLAQIVQCSAATAFCHRNRDPFFVNIQTNKSGMFHEARLLCMRLCAGHPA